MNAHTVRVLFDYDDAGRGPLVGEVMFRGRPRHRGYRRHLSIRRLLRYLRIGVTEITFHYRGSWSPKDLVVRNAPPWQTLTDEELRDLTATIVSQPAISPQSRFGA